MSAAEMKEEVARLERQLEEANETAEKQERRIDDLEGELEDANERADESKEGFLREQIDALSVDVDSSSAPQSHDQWKRCLQGILRGDDWRHRTWL